MSSTLSSLLGLAALVVSVSVAVLTYLFTREARLTRIVAGMKVLNDELGTPEIRRIRRSIFEKDENALSRLDKVEVVQADRLAVAYDRVAVLFELGVIDQKMMQAAHKEAFLEAWRRLEPVIEEVRRKNGYGDHCASFERVAHKLDHKSRRAARSATVGAVGGQPDGPAEVADPMGA